MTDSTQINDFPHMEMSPDDVGDLHERRQDEDDPDYIAGKKWARGEGIDIPPLMKKTHDEYVAVYKRIHAEAKARCPNDVVAQNRFREGAKSWAGA